MKAAATSFVVLSSVLLAGDPEPIEAPTARRCAKRLEDLGASIRYETSRDGAKSIYAVVIRESWKGGDEGVVLVETLALLHSDLRALYIVGQPSISEARLEQFERRAPNVSIERRSAAILGVAASALMGEGLQIIAVIPNSPADRAGLEQGDVLAAMDGKPLGDIQTLVKLLLPKRPGDIVTLTVYDNERKRNIQVKLGAW